MTVGSVTTDQTAVVTASANNSSQTFTLNLVAPAQLSSVSCAPIALGAGQSATCTVTLTKAVTSAATLNLSGSAAGALSVPATATIGAGSSSTTFTVAAGALSGNQPVIVTATWNGQSQTATVTVNAAVTVSGLSCSPGTMNAPSSSSCTVTVTAVAPAGGTVVTLSSNNASLTVPSSATIPAGLASVAFTATAAAVSTNQSATVTAALGSSSQTTVLSLTAPAVITLSSLTCNPTSVMALGTSTCTVTLSAAAPADGTAVALNPNDTSRGAPSSVARTLIHSVMTNPITLTSLACGPSSPVSGGSSLCTVILSDTAPSGGASIALMSDDPALIVPASVTIPEGVSSATFGATVGAVTVSHTAVVTASYGGATLLNSLVLNPAGGPPVLNVGPGQSYLTPCQAILSAPDGATIQIDAGGTYSGDVCGIFANNLTLKGIQGRPKIDAAGQNAMGKGTWVIEGNNITIDGIEFTGASASLPNNNGAGVRMEGQNLSVLNCYFHDNQEGIATNPNSSSQVLIQSTEFNHNGYGDGFTHNIHIDTAARFTMQYCNSRNANAGYLVKTLASENYITYNRLTSESGTTRLEMDIDSGGRSFVIGNLIQKGPNDQGDNLVGYLPGDSSPNNPSTELYVVNNTFVNDRPTGGNFLNMGSSETTRALVTNNIFYGPGRLSTLSNSVVTTNYVGDPLFVNEAGYDYHLTLGSPAIHAGATPGMADGVSLTPLYEYLSPSCGKIRKPAGVGVIDIGAFEFGGTGAPLPCGVSLSAATDTPNTVTSDTVTQASSGGAIVMLSSSSPSVASTPASVIVPTGSMSANFSVTTSTVSSSTGLTISAAYGGATQSATLTVTPTAAPASAFTTLTGSPTAKSGLLGSRVWSYAITNSGPGAANAAQITSLTLTQSGGPICTSQPVVGTASVSGGSAQAFPVQLGNIAPGSSIPINITIDFSNCTTAAWFTANLELSANGGATTGSVLRYNQFP